jgi:hypothetical protein
MKHFLTIATLTFLVVIPVMSQKKKSIQANKIKSTTVMQEDYEKNNGRSVKEAYTKFDESGNVIEEIEYDDYGKEKLHVQYEYDDNDNKTKEIFINPKGVREKVIEYKYEDGLKTEKIVYLPNGKIKSKKKYIYEFH